MASSSTENIPRLVKIELIRELSIEVKSDDNLAGVEVAMVSISNPCWMNPIIDS